MSFTDFFKKYEQQTHDPYQKSIFDSITLDDSKDKTKTPTASPTKSTHSTAQSTPKKKFCIGEWAKNRAKQNSNKKPEETTKIQQTKPVQKPIHNKHTTEDVVLCQIHPPMNSRRKNINLKWQIKFKYCYRDNPRKLHSKTVYFGNKKRQYYVDHGDKNRRNIDVMRLWKKHLHNPFKRQYWEVRLLQTEKNTHEAYVKLLKSI